MSFSGRNGYSHALKFPLIVATLLITLACSAPAILNLDPGETTETITGDAAKEPLDIVEEELALQTYVEETNEVWNSFQTEFGEKENRIDDIIEMISEMSSPDNLMDLDEEELGQLDEELGAALVQIEQIENRFKMLAPLRSAQDFLDYTDTITSVFINELESLADLFEQMTAQEVDIAEIEDEMNLGLSELSGEAYAYEQILFEEDVQDYMRSYVDYAEAMVVYIGLRGELIKQEANVVATLVRIREQAGDMESVNEQGWADVITELTKLQAIQDGVAFEPIPVFPGEDQTNISPRQGLVTAMRDLPNTYDMQRASGTEQELNSAGSGDRPAIQAVASTILLCGTNMLDAVELSMNSQHSSDSPEQFVRCPDLSDEEKQFLEQMDEKWQNYLEEWKERFIKGYEDIHKEWAEKSKEAQEEFDKCNEGCSETTGGTMWEDDDGGLSCTCPSRDRNLDWDYRLKMALFARKMVDENNEYRREINKEIEEWYQDMKEEITKQYGLTLTADHNMYLIEFPDYTITVSGAAGLTLNPWTGVTGLEKFTMEVNWPFGGGQIIGGDLIGTLIMGRCEEGVIYITIVNEVGGFYAHGTLIHPLGAEEMTTSQWVRSAEDAYELPFEITGTGEFTGVTVPASSLYPGIDGTLTWTLEANPEVIETQE